MEKDEDRKVIILTFKDKETGQESSMWMDFKQYQIQQDFYSMPRRDFYMKYPELKPTYPLAKVALDEKDKHF